MNHESQHYSADYLPQSDTCRWVGQSVGDQEPITVIGEHPYTLEQVTIYSDSGVKINTSRKKMARVHELIPRSIFYLYRDKAEARDGVSVGATGFFVSLQSSPKGIKHIYAVTCRHVIDRKAKVLRLNTPDGEIEALELDWVNHPNGADVSVARIDEPEWKYQLTAIPDRWFIDRDWFTRSSIFLGEEMYMVGRFSGYEGKKKNIPTVRSGILSAYPDPEEPVTFKEYKLPPQEVILVEMRSISGYSGAPVFHTLRSFDVLVDVGTFLKTCYGLEPEPDMVLEVDAPIALVGVDVGNFTTLEKVIDKRFPDQEKNLQAENHSGFSMVIPAWKILETLNRPNLMEERKKLDERHGQSVNIEDGKAVPKLNSLNIGDEEFSRETFEDALKKASQRISEPDKETKET